MRKLGGVFLRSCAAAGMVGFRTPTDLGIRSVAEEDN